MANDYRNDLEAHRQMLQRCAHTFISAILFGATTLFRIGRS